MSAYNTAKTDEKNVWFAIVIPKLTKAYYFSGNPSEMGLPETSVNSVLEITNYITPTSAIKMDVKPTLAP